MSGLWLLTAVAGGAGAVARFEVDALVGRHHRLSVPLGTIVVNASASLALGLLVGWATSHAGHDAYRSILGTGFLGGYSTFSSASVEGARLLRNGPPAAAILHAGTMLVVSLTAAGVGLAITS